MKVSRYIKMVSLFSIFSHTVYPNNSIRVILIFSLCFNLSQFHLISCFVVIEVNFNTLKQRQNGRHFPDDIFKWIFWNENGWISINISLKFVPRGPINNIPTLVQVMAWRRPGDKPLSEPVMVSLLTQICVTRPQWVNTLGPRQNDRHFTDDIFKCILLYEIIWIAIKIPL